MAESVAEFYARKNAEEAERRKAAQEVAARDHMRDVLRNPGMYSPQERFSMQRRNIEEESARRFNLDDDYRNRELGTREKVAGFGYQGQRDAGSTAANLTAEATKHTADKNFEGIEKQAQNALEIEKERQKYLDIINGRDNDTKIRQSEIEWGIHKPDGTFVPGGRVRQAEEQGKAAAQVAAQNNQAKVTVAQLNAQGKQVAAQIASDSRVKAAIAGNVMFANDPAKAQEMIETMMANGFTPQQIYAAFGVQGAGNGTETVQQTKAQKAVTQIQGEIDRRRRFGG